MLARYARNVASGARLYWQSRIAPHPITSFAFFLAFCAVEILLIVAARFEFSLAWLAVWLSFLVGDISTLIRVARCRNCGILVVPAPAYRKECPVCGHIMFP